MQIGLECFLDEQLSSMIESKPRYGKCEVLQKDDCIIYDTEKDTYLEAYFVDILDAFSVAKYLNIQDTDERVGYLKEFLDNWNIFSLVKNDIQKVLKAICFQRYEEEPELFEEKVTIREFYSVDDMKRLSLLKTYNWETFCYNIKYVNRFHSHQINIYQLKNLLENFSIDIPKETLTLYRARVCDKNVYINGYSTREMGAPPIPNTVAGRTNSEGIQCLYLSGNEQTTLHEVRARENDHVTIGEFLQKKNLRIVDLGLFEEISPFSISDFNATWFAINVEIIRKMGTEIAKPMRRFDSLLDYIPTQYICDYIKHLGYDGIKFKSTLLEDGINYAIFNERNFECLNVKLVMVHKIKYSI